MKKPRGLQEIDRIRSAILDQALDIISREGLDGLTMRRLAGRTKMTAPNLYNYYSGKDEIYLSLVVKGFEMLYRALKKARESTTDKKKRGRAMIEAYLRFGIDQPRYYDIMFVLPTPKYNDYRGTPHEQLSGTEYRISMDIVDLVARAIREMYGRDMDEQTVIRRLIQVWSLLHGMISLYNSRVATYVADDILSIYKQTIDELIEAFGRSRDDL